MRRDLRPKAADVNVSLPPGQWQTYDITFIAPQFDASGQQVKGAIITVLHNGVKVHDAVEVTKVTGGAWASRPKPDRSASRTTVIRLASATSGSCPG